MPSRLTFDAILARVTRHDDGCWTLPNAPNRNGYVQITMNQRHRLAHRLIYEGIQGEIPAGLVLDHLCRNRACVNPDHLEPVTQQENVLRSPRTIVIEEERERKQRAAREEREAKKRAASEEREQIKRQISEARGPQSKTCGRGHARTEDTTYRDKYGFLCCRLCRNERARDRMRQVRLKLRMASGLPIRPHCPTCRCFEHVKEADG